MGFGTLGLQSLVTGTVPWALAPDVGIDIDFVNNRGFNIGSAVGLASSFVTCARAGPPLTYSANSSGVYQSFAPNIARITDLGLLVEEIRTNVVLWNRDLTNVAWTASNVTVAKDQTGIDGTATSASSLLATAGNGTVLQAITLGSSARWQSAFVKRITGNGTINMTMDNGSTWTAIVPTTSWTQLSIPTQTIASPTVGFQIVTSGDKIAVDGVQNETGTFATSPIFTTTVSMGRNTDIVKLTTSPTYGNASTVYFHGSPISPTAFATVQNGISLDDGTLTNRLNLFRVSGLVKGFTSPGAVVFGGGHSWAQNTIAKVICAVANGDQAMSFAGNAAETGAGTWPPGVTLTQTGIGETGGSGGSPWNGYIRRIGVWPSTRVPNATLVTLST